MVKEPPLAVSEHSDIALPALVGARLDVAGELVDGVG